jgi:hypothetical protein
MSLTTTEKNEIAIKKKGLTHWRTSQNKFACRLSQLITSVFFLIRKPSGLSWMI